MTSLIEIPIREISVRLASAHGRTAPAFVHRHPKRGLEPASRTPVRRIRDKFLRAGDLITELLS
jgi:hypothetical protein